MVYTTACRIFEEGKALLATLKSSAAIAIFHDVFSEPITLWQDLNDRFDVAKAQIEVCEAEASISLAPPDSDAWEQFAAGMTSIRAMMEEIRTADGKNILVQYTLVDLEHPSRLESRASAFKSRRDTYADFMRECLVIGSSDNDVDVPKIERMFDKWFRYSKTALAYSADRRKEIPGTDRIAAKIKYRPRWVILFATVCGLVIHARKGKSHISRRRHYRGYIINPIMAEELSTAERLDLRKRVKTEEPEPPKKRARRSAGPDEDSLLLQ